MKPITARNKPCAVVTGAGSGIGRAVALHLASQGWRVALVGRRRRALVETANSVPGAKKPVPFPCDISDPDAVEDLKNSVLKRFGGVDALINSAGMNVPNRSLAVLSEADYRYMIGTNLHGAYYCVQAFLPQMRRRRQGTIVNISSDAGRQASVKSGVGYVVSKFGLTGLTQAINVEERVNGIRACCIFPGDVATPLLEHRPVPPSAKARGRMLQPEDVAACVWLALSLPARATLEEVVIRPSLAG